VGGAAVGSGSIRVNQWLEESRFNRFHFVVFLLCLGLMTMDGYDLFVYGAAVPLLMRSFDMSAAQAGALASAASIGTLVGALIFGPLADKVGRKTTMIATIVLCCVSMAMAGLTHSVASFGFWRFLFGVGNGGMVPNIMALASEYVPGRNRATLVAGISAGVQCGGLIGASLGLWAFPHYGWRFVFLVAALPILLLPAWMKYMPEATTHLYKTGRVALLREILRKARPAETLSDTAALEVDKGSEKVPLRAVFRERRAFSTFVFWIVYGVNLYVIYGFTIWLPKLMMNQGYSLASGLTFLLMLSSASILGSFLAGYIADRVGARRLLFCLYLIAAIALGLVGYSHNYALLMVLVGLAGAGFNGAQNIINSYIPAYYPPSMRSTAMAYNFGFGRLGSIFGPAAIGILMALHFSYQTTVIALALPSLISAAGILCIREEHGYGRRMARAGSLTSVERI